MSGAGEEDSSSWARAENAPANNGSSWPITMGVMELQLGETKNHRGMSRGDEKQVYGFSVISWYDEC